jgi:alcohol dehydrogenase
MPKTPLLFCGSSAFFDLDKFLRSNPVVRIFLVSARKSYSLCGAEEIFSKILDKFFVVNYCEFDENPKIEDVEIGIRLFKENNCDLVIAVGGGSVIDMAKLINLGQANKSTLHNIVQNPKNIDSQGSKLIAIPTTAGTGSEATHFAVLYIDKVKYSVAHIDYLLPDIAVLYSPFTYSLNKYQSAITGIDAFAQSVESYWSVNSTVESKKIARDAIRMIWSSLPKAVFENDKDAREVLLYASYLSGKAINISKTTGAHALSYPLTSYYNIPHGHAVALTLAEWFDFNMGINLENIEDRRGVSYVKETLIELSELFVGKGTGPASEAIRSFINSLGIETRLSKLGIKISDIDFLAESIILERLNNNPVMISKEQIKEMFLRIY